MIRTMVMNELCEVCFYWVGSKPTLRSAVNSKGKELIKLIPKKELEEIENDYKDEEIMNYAINNTCTRVEAEEFFKGLDFYTVKEEKVKQEVK